MLIVENLVENVENQAFFLLDIVFRRNFLRRMVLYFVVCCRKTNLIFIFLDLFTRTLARTGDTRLAVRSECS
jgi:hypothetical protein